MRLHKLWSVVVLISLLASAAFFSAGAAQTETPREETLKIAISGKIQDPTNMNMTNWSADRATTGLHQLAYEYFFYHNLQTNEYIPWLATGYEYNDDFTALTVHLRDGVTWNDGEPFTADDVVFTYDIMRENQSMSWADVASAKVKSVEKVDDLTVVFNLATPNPRIHFDREAFPVVGVWGGITILPKHIWESEDPLTFKNNPPVTTGPYTLKDASETAVIWDRRDDWWGTEAFGITPPAKEVQFLFLGAESNVAQALENNEIDTPQISILSPGSFQQVAESNDKVRAWTADAPYAWQDPCPRAMMIQNANAPLDKPEVRWAISYLVDRQAVVDLAYEGTTVPAWGIWPEYTGNLPYFEAIDDLRAEYPSDAYDPDKAAELFEQAGVDPGDLNLSFLVNGDSNEEMAVSQIIADQLTAGGINVEINAMSGNPLNDAILVGDYDLKVHSFCPGYIVENLDLFQSKYFEELGERAPWYERNSFRYNNPELDPIIDQMIETDPNDTATLTGLYHDAMEIWLRDLPVVPIVQAPALVPFNSTYWTGWPSADDPWNMPVSWWATFNLVINGYQSPETGEVVGGIKPAGTT